MTTCFLDNTTHADRAALHKHLRGKLKQEDYYRQYHPRVDRFTGEPIPFKHVDQYLSTEFLTVENLRGWLNREREAGKQWAIDWLAKRKAEKDLTYPPTQVELRSLIAPSVAYYEWAGGYNAICQQLGYTVRFDGALTGGSVSPSRVIIDTREQQPLHMPGGSRGKLNCGDYGVAVPNDGVYIERKSLGDFVGTLSQGLDRFVREIERAKEVGDYLVVLVEAPVAVALDFKTHLPHVKVHPDHVFHVLRDLLHRFDNLQALFVKDRIDAARCVTRILGAGTSIKRVDLQRAHEQGDLI